MVTTILLTASYNFRINIMSETDLAFLIHSFLYRKLWPIMTYDPYYDYELLFKIVSVNIFFNNTLNVVLCHVVKNLLCFNLSKWKLIIFTWKGQNRVIFQTTSYFKFRFRSKVGLNFLVLAYLLLQITAFELWHLTCNLIKTSNYILIHLALRFIH